ncbi:MAG: hypothetical protein AAF663_10990 [Planctomycetota bacterium]
MSVAASTSREALTTATSHAPDDAGYGRARLRLGITGVGLWVLFCTTFLLADTPTAVRTQLPPGPIGDGLLVASLLLVYVVVQLPLDLLGGYLVPKSFGRDIPTAADYSRALARGVFGHCGLLATSAIVLYVGGLSGGMFGALAAGLAWIGLLAAARGQIARRVAALPTETKQHSQADLETLSTKLINSADEGFTGGITGLVKPRTNCAPAAWEERLTPEQFALTQARRSEVVRSGAWRFGRIAALTFNAVGLMFALTMAGSSAAGTGVGVVETSLWFTLWSFMGLLTLPTLSRAAVQYVDERLINRGVDRKQLDDLISELDRMQDGETERHLWIERVFHPIPSVANRHRRRRVVRGKFWDVARTSVYLGIAGMSLLTRSVHCNVGRPALWVWLPVD